MMDHKSGFDNGFYDGDSPDLQDFRYRYPDEEDLEIEEAMEKDRIKNNKKHYILNHPWRQGELFRDNPLLKDMDTKTLDNLEQEERQRIYAHFSHEDLGKSRELVCHIPNSKNREVYKQLITLVPDMYTILDKLIKLCEGDKNHSTEKHSLLEEALVHMKGHSTIINKLSEIYTNTKYVLKNIDKAFEESV